MIIFILYLNFINLDFRYNRVKKEMMFITSNIIRNLSYRSNAGKVRSDGGCSNCTDQYVLNNVKNRFDIEVPAVGKMNLVNLFHDRIVIGGKHEIADPLPPLLQLVWGEYGCHILIYRYGEDKYLCCQGLVLKAPVNPISIYILPIF